MNKIPSNLTIMVSKRYRDLLDGHDGNWGDKAQIIRLAFKTQLPQLDAVTFAVTVRKLHGPFRSKVNITPQRGWYGELVSKARELETTPGTLARVALCRFLDEVARAEKVTE